MLERPELDCWLPALRGAVWICVLLLPFTVPIDLWGAVTVIENRTDIPVSLTISSDRQATRDYRVGPAEVVAVPVSGPVDATYRGGNARATHQLDPDSLYLFSRPDDRLELRRVEFASVDRQPGEGAFSTQPGKPSPLLRGVGGVMSFFEMGIVPVIALVDDEERTVEAVWMERLRGRLEKASDIIEPCCGLRFRVVATGTWHSDDENEDWEQATREFESEVIPAPAALAIGFTSQYELPLHGRMHLGTIRGPLRPHVLICEGPPGISEPERLEVLVHELGHYLGAVHCPQPDSVMRPLLGDGRARARSFPIRFDGVNTLIMNLVADEIRNRGIRTLSQVSSGRKQKLHSIYQTVAGAIAHDKVPLHHIRMLDVTPIGVPAPVVKPESLVAATRAVVKAMVESAETNRRNQEPLSGDRLTESLFRRAAGIASSLPFEHRRRAFLLGVAIGIDDSDVLRRNVLTGPFVRQVESDAERDRRLTALGTPTIDGHRDRAQHFVVSCGLTALYGPGIAEAAGVSKELLDAKRGRGFSFADLAADLAGIALAERIAEDGSNLDELAESFSLSRYFPECDDLAATLTWSEFFRTYGSVHDKRFLQQRARIQNRIQALENTAKR